MNKRIRKKEEKKSLMESSFELVPEYPFRKRKRIVNKLWKMYHEGDTTDKIIIGYKRRNSS